MAPTRSAAWEAAEGIGLIVLLVAFGCIALFSLGLISALLWNISDNLSVVSEQLDKVLRWQRVTYNQMAITDQVIKTVFGWSDTHDDWSSASYSPSASPSQSPSLSPSTSPSPSPEVPAEEDKW